MIPRDSFYRSRGLQLQGPCSLREKNKKIALRIQWKNSVDQYSFQITHKSSHDTGKAWLIVEIVGRARLKELGKLIAYHLALSSTWCTYNDCPMPSQATTKTEQRTPTEVNGGGAFRLREEFLIATNLQPPSPADAQISQCHLLTN